VISNEQEEAVLRQLSDDIRQLAHHAYQNIVEAILGGMTPRAAINQEMLAAKVMEETSQFAAGFYQQFSQGLSAILSQSVSARDVMDIQLDGIKLSDALYQSLAATQSGVIAILRDHFAGIAQARGIALAIYTGYGIPNRNGLVDLLNSAKRMGSIGAPGNPKYMVWHTLNDTQLLNRVRDVLRTGNPAREFMSLGRIIRDPAAKAALERIYLSTQAGQLKTPALRAAYLNRITTWATHDAGPARDNALRVAYEEKMRYMANRIAQTESHRAYSQALAREFAADDRIQYVQVRAGPGHTPDVCDVHLMANPTGLGSGIYVKGKAPVPAYHPWCRCKLLNREDLDPNYDKPGPKQSAIQYLKTLDEKEAARIVGSKAKWQRVLAGEKLQDVIDGGKPDMYKLKTIYDILQEKPIV
jgi:hypothetical protein